MGTRTVAKITPLPPKQPSWLINVSTEELLNEQPCGMIEITEMLGLCREKVVELILNEGLPAKKMGKRWEFYKPLVRAWRINRQFST